jgi:2-polyprenyl-3-methyl-5-hydroxy-6-metoxy-1,4-benzoquinol methylase
MNSEIACIACGSTQCRQVSTILSEQDCQHYCVYRCRVCGLTFVFPMPTLSFEALQGIYGEEYVSEQRQAGDTHEGIEALRRATHRQMDIVERYVGGRTALNIGAMNGAIGVLAERGWNLKIVEVSAHAAETARMRWGFDVTVSRIEDAAFAAATFDFIKMGHVIEHLGDPHAVLAKIAKLLRPGGMILIDTDNGAGLKTQIEVTVRRAIGERVAASLVQKTMGKNLRKRYGRLTPPEHLYTFSEHSLGALLERTGFEIVEVFQPAWGDETWFPLSDTRGLSSVARLFLQIDRVGAKFGHGEVLAILARKQDTQ